MKIFTILKQIVILIQSIKSLITDNSTLENGYVIFPNGLKICWGYFSDQKWGGTVALPITFLAGYAMSFPEYSYSESWRVHYSCGKISNTNKITLYPYDNHTHDNSTSTKLSGIFLIIGY